MGLSQGYGSADDTESIAAIHAALDAGVTLLDTAISYGQGHNEALVGRAVASSGMPRENLQIATKFGIVRGDHGVHLEPTRTALQVTVTSRCVASELKRLTCTTCTA